MPIRSTMPDVALEDVNKVAESERMNGNSSNGNLIKPMTETKDETIGEKLNKKMAPLVDLPIDGEGAENSGGEPVNVEIEYIESENLKDVEDVENCLQVVMLLLIHRYFPNPSHDIMLIPW